MRVAINHQTIYRYPAPASYSIQYLRLTPLSGLDQRVLSWKLNTPGTVRPWTDAYGNLAHVLVLDEPHEEIHISATGEVEIADGRPLLGDGDLPVELFLRTTPLTEADERVRDFAGGFQAVLTANQQHGLDSLLGGVRETVELRPLNGHAAQSASQALEAKEGTCREHSHLFVSCCRALGIPARYVSGYLCADAGDNTIAAHAWAEAWVDGAGWQSFDAAASRKSNARAHLRVATGLDATDVAPVRSWRRGGNDGTEVHTTVADIRPARKQVQQ